jgi:hypothetical protein
MERDTMVRASRIFPALTEALLERGVTLPHSYEDAVRAMRAHYGIIRHAVARRSES